MTRAEHLQWCKDRAHKEYDFYKVKQPERAVANAVSSMCSDLGKYPETERMGEIAVILGISVMQRNDERELFRYIDGFN